MNDPFKCDLLKLTLADAKNDAFYRLIVTIFHNDVHRIMAEIWSYLMQEILIVHRTNMIQKTKKYNSAKLCS